MTPHSASRPLVLVLAGLVAFVIGAIVLVDPSPFYASNGIVLGANASLLSETRAPGGALVVSGLLMLAGVFRKDFAFTSTLVATVLYLAYAASRVLSLALDGVPSNGVLVAMAGEWIVGALCLLELRRFGASSGAGFPGAVRSGR